MITDSSGQEESAPLPSSAAIEPRLLPSPALNPQSAVGSTTLVSIVSNSRLLRDGLGTLLKQAFACELVATWPAEPLPSARLPSPPGHIVLLDCGMGLSTLRQWTQYWRGLPAPAKVLTIEIDDEANTILACVELGVSNYTLRGASVEEIVDAIRSTQQGHAVCPPHITALLFDRLATIRQMQFVHAHPTMPLTGRELQVLGLVARGYSNKEIAREFSVTLSTIKQHVHNILDKLELRHRREAVSVATQHGWLPTQDIPAHQPKKD